jgi:hypothetical protein
VSVTVSNGVASYQAPDVYIDYQPVQQANTLAITNATYTSRKNTLAVDATSDYPNAALVIEYSGINVPMNFVRLLKGKYLWSFIDADVATIPETVTVVGLKGSAEKAVAKK